MGLNILATKEFSEGLQFGEAAATNTQLNP